MTHSDRPDMSFGVRAQPLAILQLLSSIEPTYADFQNGEYQLNIKTFPWYGGVALQIVRYPDQPNTLILTWSENQKSDEIVVQYWDTRTDKTRISGPVIDDKPVWVNNHKFTFGDFAGVVRHITQVIQDFYVESGMDRQERLPA